MQRGISGGTGTVLLLRVQAVGALQQPNGMTKGHWRC